MALILGAMIILLAMRIAWVDIRKLEIEFETLAVMAVIGFAHSLVVTDIFETLIRLFAGIAFWGCLVFCIRYVPGLARIGAGDPPLIGVIAFLVAPAVLQWAVLAAICIMATCAIYSIKRGKKLFKSMFPAAPPLLLAAVLVFVPVWMV